MVSPLGIVLGALSLHANAICQKKKLAEGISISFILIATLNYMISYFLKMTQSLSLILDLFYWSVCFWINFEIFLLLLVVISVILNTSIVNLWSFLQYRPACTCTLGFLIWGCNSMGILMQIYLYYKSLIGSNFSHYLFSTDSEFEELEAVPSLSITEGPFEPPPINDVQDDLSVFFSVCTPPELSSLIIIN